MPKDMRQDRMMLALVAGRSMEQQAECVRSQGNYSDANALRRSLLNALGVYRGRRRAENVILGGCYLPFSLPQSLRSYVEILEHLGLEYTFLDKEYCCGLPMVEMNEGEEREKAQELAKEFMRMNLSRGRELGAKKAVYCCVWCAYLAKKLLPDEDVDHLYYPDLIVDRLEQEDLRLKPTVVGYYEGCHARNRDWALGVRLNWARYRKLLDRIQGLKVVDLPRRVCCADHPERIVEEATRLNLGTIVCSCLACQMRVGQAAGGQVQMKFLPDLLRDALRP